MIKKNIFAFIILILSFGVNDTFAYQEVIVEQNIKDIAGVSTASEKRQGLGKLSNLGLENWQNLTLNLETVGDLTENHDFLRILIRISDTSTASSGNNDLEIRNSSCTGHIPFLEEAVNREEVIINLSSSSICLWNLNTGTQVNNINGLSVIKDKYYFIRILNNTAQHSRVWGSSADNYPNGSCMQNCGSVADIYFELEGTRGSVSTLVTTYPDATQTDTLADELKTGRTNQAHAGQSFTPTNTWKVDTIKAKLKKIGEPTDNWNLEIWECRNQYRGVDTTDSNGCDQTLSDYSTYPIIRLGSSSIISGKDILSNFTNYIFEFPGGVNLISDKHYVFLFNRSGDLDDSNYLTVKYYSNGDIYPNLNGGNYQNCLDLVTTGCGGSFAADLLFELSFNFHSQIQNSSTLSLGESYGTSSTILRTLPQGWVVKVIETTDENGNYMEADGYRWYKVQDPTDGHEGYMKAVNIDNGIIYLDYDENTQTDLETKTELQTTRADRVPVIIEAVDKYVDTTNTGNSLYEIGGADGNNNFAGFITDEQFSRELALAIIGEETGSTTHALNNEICNDNLDGGIGLMQLTRYVNSFTGLIDEPKGRGSGMSVPEKDLDCKKPAYTSSTTDYYSNSTQGIYANIKDGFRHLQGKHGATLNWIGNQDPSYTHSGLTFDTYDIKKISTTARYNGACGYVRRVSNALDNLETLFQTGVVPTENQSDVDLLADKLYVAGTNSLCFKLHSPGVLSVVDSSGNKTGVFNSTESEDIELSLFDSNTKTGAIFFPQDTYSYLVQGTDTGVYGLTIDFNDNSETPTSVDLKNINLTSDTVHKFTVDWSEVSSTGNGVHVEVDKDGDGTYDYNFDTTSTLDDTTPPTTTHTLSGTAGNNGWYTSDVTVSLLATDNTGGVGVHKTEYSLDNGTTWIEYTNSFTITNESNNNTILYRSTDYVGNTESTNSIIIKIDKTSPEAETYFNQSTKEFQVDGTDNLTTTTVTQTSTTDFLIEDEAGNTLKLVFTDTSTTTADTTNIVDTKLLSMQYNSGTTINPNTDLRYVYDPAKSQLTQSIDAPEQFKIATEYFPIISQTVVIEAVNGEVSQKTISGNPILKLLTDQGLLQHNF